MNLTEWIPIQEVREHSLRRTRPAPTRAGTNRPGSGAAWIAGATAFLLTATWMTASRKIRQHRAMRRYFSGETTDRLAASADRIVELIERGSREAAATGGYPASFPLELEREQHRMTEAYGSLYRKLDAAEQGRLIEPERLLVFNGIAAFERLPIAEAPFAAAPRGSRTVASSEPETAAGEDARSGAAFVPDPAQHRALSDLYALCLHIRELASTDNRASYSAERSERSAARLLNSIGRADLP